MHRMTPLALAGLLCLAGGCATLSTDECLTADWRIIGYEDGVQGHGGDRIGRHREACAKAGVTPDLAAYRTGRREGLEQFCRPGNGFSEGRRGAPYQGVCPPDLEPAFLDGYREGLEIHRLEQAVYAVQREIADVQALMAETDDGIAEREELLDGEDLGTAERRELRREIRELVRDQARLEDHHHGLVHELSVRSEALQLALTR